MVGGREGRGLACVTTMSIDRYHRSGGGGFYSICHSAATCITACEVAVDPLAE